MWPASLTQKRLRYRRPINRTFYLAEASVSKIFYSVAFFITGAFFLSIGYLHYCRVHQISVEAERVDSFLSKLPVVKDDSVVKNVKDEAVWRCHASRYGDDCGWENDWVYSETANHVIYDGLYIQRLCPGFYRGFRMVGDLNAVLYMRHAKGRMDKWLTLDVYELPAHSSLYDVSACPGISAKDGMLTMYGKRLAMVKDAHIPPASLTGILRR